jgi:hypothetical protein
VSGRVAIGLIWIRVWIILRLSFRGKFKRLNVSFKVLIRSFKVVFSTTAAAISTTTAVVV